jgi:PAS domain S-box-containing protein
MALSRQVVEQIKDLLRQNPQGLSITDIARTVNINRNTAGRYLDKLLLSGKVEMHHFGMAKLFRLSERLPVSAVLSISSELVLQLDSNLRIIFINDPFLEFIRATAKDIVGKNIEYTIISSIFEDVFSDLLIRLREGVAGIEWGGELFLPERQTIFFCRVVPTVFNEGPKGVSVLFEDISERKRDEEQIRHSEERLRSIIRVAPIGIGMVKDRVFIEVNARFCQITGFTSAELIGQSVRMLYLTEEEFDRVGVVKYTMVRDRGTGSVETKWRRKDGTIIDILLSSTPLNPDDISGGLTFTALDITGRKRAEESLRESEAKLQLALSGSEMGMWELDIPSSKGLIDERAASILGYQKSDIGLYHADWDALSHPDDVPLIHQRLADYLEGRSSIFESEHRMRHASGRWIWVVGRGKIAGSLRDNSCIRIIGTMQNITERKVAEEKLRESEEKFRTMVEASPDIIWEIDLLGNFTFVSARSKAILGYSPEDLIGGSFNKPLRPDFVPEIQSRFFDHIRNKSSLSAIDIPVIRDDGEQSILEIRAVPIISPDGSIVGFRGIARDITERKQGEQELRESEDRYRNLVEISPDAVILHLNSTIIYVNPAAVNLLGARNPEEIIGKSAFEFIQQDDRERVIENVKKDLEGEKTPSVELQMLRIDGTPIVIEGRGVGTYFGGKQAVLVAMRDITERKKKEDALRCSQERYRRLLEQSFDAIATHKEGKIMLVNDATVAILGASSQEQLIGKSIYDFIHPKSQPVAKERLSRLGTRDIMTLPLIKETFVRVDGRPVDVEVMSTSFMDNGVPAVQVVFRKVQSDSREQN